MFEALTPRSYTELSKSSAGERIGLPSDRVETVWTSCRDGKYCESVDIEPKNSEFMVSQEVLILHTDATTHVCRSGDHVLDS